VQCGYKAKRNNSIAAGDVVSSEGVPGEFQHVYRIRDITNNFASGWVWKICDDFFKAANQQVAAKGFHTRKVGYQPVRRNAQHRQVVLMANF
jgi:hypothetical protein